MGIEGDVDSCLYEIAVSIFKLFFGNCLVNTFVSFSSIVKDVYLNVNTFIIQMAGASSHVSFFIFFLSVFKIYNPILYTYFIGLKIFNLEKLFPSLEV